MESRPTACLLLRFSPHFLDFESEDVEDSLG